MLRGFKFRLYPTAEQAAVMMETASVCRFVYNLALEQRRDWWRQYRASTGRPISAASQSREVTDLRRDCSWIASVERVPIEQALRDLDAAFRRFFDGRGGYPKFRQRHGEQSFRCRALNIGVRRLSAKWSAVRVPKVGWVRYRDSRPLQGELRNATFSCIAGQWFVSFQCLIEHKPEPTTLPSVGIDRGIANTLSLSTGEHFQIPASLAKLDRRKRKAQRVLARRKRGSNRRAAQIQRVSRLSAKIARVRRDWQHRVTTDIARRFGHVALESLRIPNMTASGRGKRGLNRSILAQGWGSIALMLAYKIKARGGTFHEINPAYTSQTCAECGVIDKLSRESQARFVCRHCGHEAHADTNAAREILRRSTASMRAEGSGYAPVETRTINHRPLAA